MKVKTPEYLNEKDLDNLSRLNNEYLNIRKLALDTFNVDLASTDNSRKITIHNELPSFIPRFSRNGVDGLMENIPTELKTSKIENEKAEASFQFHVMR